MTQSKSNGIQDNAATTHNFVWTGRNDLEDGALGTRVHHITKQVHSSELSNELTDGAIAWLASPAMQVLQGIKDAWARNKHLT